MTKRMVLWSSDGLEFWERRGSARGRLVARLPFEQGPLGAYALIVGTAAWLYAHNSSEHWTRRGMLPAHCVVPAVGA